MIGQNNLLVKIDDMLVEDRFPRFSIVVGERGMEHEDVARYVAHRMGADYIQLPDVKIDTIRLMIQRAYKLHKPTVYCIRFADDMSVNAKNALLKVVEDTPNKAYFVMCLEDLSNALATIQSRGIVLRMDRPTQDDIREFARECGADEKSINVIGNICNSPGDVMTLIHHNAVNFYEYAEYMADAMITMSGAEVFKLSEKLALKDEEDKYDCRLFLKALQQVLLNRANAIIDDSEEFIVKIRISNAIGRYLQDLRIKGINKNMLIDNMILEVRKIWKSQK